MTTQQRYEAAVAYVRRAIAAVENHVSSVPGFHAIDAYAARLKNEPARDELARVEARWLRAASDVERARVARDAELLADRAQENLPGAPQDRRRTNLFKREQPTATPATSYARELEHQMAAIGGSGGDAAASIGWGTLLLLGGGAALAGQLYRWFQRKQIRNRRSRNLRPLVNRRLEEAARRTP